MFFKILSDLSRRSIPSTCDVFYTYLILIKDTRCAQWRSRQIMKCSNSVKIVNMISWWKYYVMNHAGTSIQFLYTQIYTIQKTLVRQNLTILFSILRSLQSFRVREIWLEHFWIFFIAISCMVLRRIAHLHTSLMIFFFLTVSPIPLI